MGIYKSEDSNQCLMDKDRGMYKQHTSGTLPGLVPQRPSELWPDEAKRPRDTSGEDAGVQHSGQSGLVHVVSEAQTSHKQAELFFNFLMPS